MCTIPKNAKLGSKGTWPRSRNLLSDCEIHQYFQNGESYKLPKVVNGDDLNLRPKPPSWFRGRALSGKGRAGGIVGL